MRSFMRNSGSSGHLFKVSRLNSLLLLAVFIICAALFQFAQLRSDYIERLQRDVEISGIRLNDILSYENQGLLNLAERHGLSIADKNYQSENANLEAYFDEDSSAKDFSVSRVNPFVDYDRMGIVFGLNTKRFIESDYQRELLAALAAMDSLKTLKEYNKSVSETYYYSFKGFVALQPWTEIKLLFENSGSVEIKELMAKFGNIIFNESRGLQIHRVEKGAISQEPALMISQPVLRNNAEWGSYGALLNLNSLRDELYIDPVPKMPMYIFVGDQKLVSWTKDGQIDLPQSQYIHLGPKTSKMRIQKGLFEFDLLYVEPNQSYGLGLEINEGQLFLWVLPKMWVYIALIVSLFLFITLLEMHMINRYYKPALILSRALVGNEASAEGLVTEKSELWNPIYQRLTEYFNLLSVTNALPGAILQIVKSGDKYMIKYCTKGLENLYVKSTNAPLKTDMEFLRIFDPNSYWNLENLMRDSGKYMIPIEYEACLNSENSEKTFVSVLLKPQRRQDNSLFWEGIILNVSDRRLLEQEISEEKRFIEKMFNLSGAFFAVLDKETAVIRCNQTFQKMFPQTGQGCDPEILIENLFTPFDFVNFKDQCNQVLQGASTSVFEHYWVFPDGRRKLIKSTIAPMYDANAEVECIVLTAIDISDRYKIEEELKKTNQNLYLKNAQVERSARIQKGLFKTFEDLRDAENIEEIFTILTKVIGQISNFHNFLLAMKVNKQSTDMKVLDLLGDFSNAHYSNYFHYFRGILGRVLLSRIPYITGNALNDPDYIVDNENVRSIIYIPITYNNFLWGVLGIDSYMENAFSIMDFEILNVLSSHLGLYMEELHNRSMLKNEADQLRGLHHVIQDISSLRNNDEISQRIVENGLLKHLAIFRTTEEGDYDLVAESVPSSYDLYGIMPNYAIIDHSLSKNKIINGRIGALNVFHLACPVCVNGKVAGILYSIKDNEFSLKDEELILIISEQIAVFWRLNNMIERSNHDALIDPLTGIWNRRYMIDRLTDENHRNNRYNSHSSIAIIDLGEFKAINDNYGHHVGDEVLSEIAIDFSGLMRGSDFVGRYGGDEFIVYMPNTTQVQSEVLLKRIAKETEQKAYSTHKLFISLDYGIATVPDDGNDLFDALKTADERMYKLKNNRKAHALNP